MVELARLGRGPGDPSGGGAEGTVRPGVGQQDGRQGAHRCPGIERDLDAPFESCSSSSGSLGFPPRRAGVSTTRTPPSATSQISRTTRSLTGPDSSVVSVAVAAVTSSWMRFRLLVVATVAWLIPPTGCRGSGAMSSPGNGVSSDGPGDGVGGLDRSQDDGSQLNPTDLTSSDPLVDAPSAQDAPVPLGDAGPVPGNDASQTGDVPSVQCGRAEAPCRQDADCCGRACASGRCCETVPGQCSPAGCCGRACLVGSFGQRACCGLKGASCSFGDECCSGVCQRVSGVSLLCGCLEPGRACKTSTDCCQGSCRAGQCACVARREPCRFNHECCSNVCREGSCL